MLNIVGVEKKHSYNIIWMVKNTMKKSLEKGRKKLIVIANFAILYKDFSYQKTKELRRK